MKKAWSEKEVEILTNKYNNTNIKDLCKILGRSEGSIQSKAKRMHICVNNCSKWNNSDLEYLKNHYALDSIDEICRHLNREYNSIVLKANRLGLKKLKRNNEHMSIYSVDENYFSIIDTPNKAYYLGWAITDGNIVNAKKSYQFRIRLKDIDIDIIKKFKKDIMSTSPIYNRNGYCEMNICNREFVYNMLQYGFSNNKTYNIKFPKIKDEFMIDFIKGCFDGDGSYVCTDKTKK